MLIDINLLPEKQEKKYTVFLVISILLICAALIFTILFLQYQQTRQQIDFVQKQIDNTKLLRVIQEQKLTDYSSSSAVSELNSAIAWAEELPIPTVYLIRQLSLLLPERGYVLNFNYNDDGKVYLTVQFDTSREVAYYLKGLKDSEFIKSVELSNIITSVTDESPEINDEKTILLPRYVAQFELNLDRAVLKDSEKKEESRK